MRWLVSLVLTVAVSAQDGGGAGLEEPVEVCPGVWFQQSHHINVWGSNVGWVELDDGVVVIDAAFPRGAERALDNIAKTTGGKPVRYAVATHYHDDHSFGAGVFAAQGATVIAQENAARDYLGRMEAYRARAVIDKSFRAHDPYAPDVTFQRKLVLGSGEQRIELLWYGHAHTSGDLFAWLPDRKVLFTGDACVDGAFNYLGDADTGSWIDVLSHAQALGAEMVVPGHGGAGSGDLLGVQKRYFVELRAQVAAQIAAGASLEQMRESVDVPMWREWTGEARMTAAHIEHVYGELTRGNLAGSGLGSTRGSVVAIPIEGEDRPRLKFVTTRMAAEQVAALRDAAPNLEIVTVSDRAEALRHAADLHGIAAHLCTPELLRAAPELRWVQSFSAGVERYIAMPELTDNDAIVLTNMKGMHGPAIADHVMAMLLHLVRALPHYQEQMTEGRWDRGRQPNQGELEGKTMFVVGLGGIGRQVAQRAHAFGMRVVATARTARPAPFYVDRLEAAGAFDELLATADAVAVCVPLTPETEGMFGAEQFAAMKKGSYFLNIARGKVCDTDALIAALESGHLAGAGLDVCDPEPAPPDHPIWKTPNVLLTPHIASRSVGTTRRKDALFAENARRFAAGEPLLNVVDKKAGY